MSVFTCFYYYYYYYYYYELLNAAKNIYLTTKKFALTSPCRHCQGTLVLLNM